jgi:hypothetical protein
MFIWRQAKIYLFSEVGDMNTTGDGFTAEGGAVLFFMIKQKIIRDKMSLSNLRRSLLSEKIFFRKNFLNRGP